MPSSSSYSLLVFLLLFILSLILPGLTVAGRVRVLATNLPQSCPLNFSVLQPFLEAGDPSVTDVRRRCQFSLQGLHLVLSVYLRTDGVFLPPPNASEACWDAYGALIGRLYRGFDVRSSCGLRTDWIAEGCMNITSRSQFESRVPAERLRGLGDICNHSLEDNAACSSCTTALASIQSAYFSGPSAGNVTECSVYPFIYAAAVVNSLAPADPRAAVCFFLMDSYSSKPSRSKAWVYGLASTVVALFALLVLGSLLVVRRFLARRKKELEATLLSESNPNLRLDSMSASTTFTRFSFEEIKSATANFSRHNIIGKGGFGNVYRGVLYDGSEVALKRFKNCSAAGDASFTHEVEVIASIRHRNLVALRGFCISTTPLEGHQRILVCELVRNGSLYDHLFGPPEKKLSWPLRQKIAIGTARGLAYLHYGAQPAIIHRDIKTSNILLDEEFEPKVADFGLAKFTPEGVSHLSTRVAGTPGYVAPEYALYGQLTEKSDAYSFGVLLLELLSGKKAVIAASQSQTTLVADWAWSLVKRGRTLDVVEEGIPDRGPDDVLERYVLAGVLASHPQMHARPTMDQMLKILENDLPVPVIPDRPVPIIAGLDEIEKSTSSSGSGGLSTPVGYQCFHFESSFSSSNGKES